MLGVCDLPSSSEEKLDGICIKTLRTLVLSRQAVTFRAVHCVGDADRTREILINYARNPDLSKPESQLPEPPGNQPRGNTLLKRYFAASCAEPPCGWRYGWRSSRENHSPFTAPSFSARSRSRRSSSLSRCRQIAQSAPDPARVNS